MVVASHPDGPLHVLEVALGGRHADVRWEWDLEPPLIGSVVELAVRPETLRFYAARPPAEPEAAPDEPAAGGR